MNLDELIKIATAARKRYGNLPVVLHDDQDWTGNVWTPPKYNPRRHVAGRPCHEGDFEVPEGEVAEIHNGGNHRDDTQVVIHRRAFTINI